MNTCIGRPLALLAASLIFVSACEQKSPTPSTTPAPATEATAAANAGPEYLTIHAALPKEALDADAGKGGAMSATLALHSPTFQRLLDATKRPDCDFAVDRAAGFDAVMPHLGKVRGLARALRADAERALAAGDLDAAAQRAAAMIRFGRHINLRSESIIEWLVAGAVGSMGAKFVTEHPQLAKAAWKTDIQQAITEATPGDPFGLKRTLKAERAVAVRSLRENKVPDMSGMGGRNWKTVPQAERDQIANDLEKLWDRVLEAWDAPDAQAKLRTLLREAESSPMKGLLPAIDKVYKSVESLQADFSAANAILR
jgi:hypothetical protein